MTSTIMIHNLDVPQFEELIKSTVKEQIDELKQSLNKDNQDELLTREETYKLLKIDSSTLWAWTKMGKLKVYGIANRRYYKRNEVLDCLILVKQKTT
ncbi:helix-turn-helix domain-containing protein [Flavobacterium sp. LB3P122]|uniref:helix-turn-helix domain-containing protein n=1 Tax=Flavobacterium algoriphilum TaxID=3398738 RepID=UPI003A85F981